jgi:hypothetical protein
VDFESFFAGLAATCPARVSGEDLDFFAAVAGKTNKLVILDVSST